MFSLTKLITAVINIFYPAIGLSLVSSSSSFVIINKLTYLLLLFPNTEPMCRPASVSLEGFHFSPIPDIPLMCFALYILLKGQRALHLAARNNNVEAAKRAT
jgi:hypothetical protein